VEFFRIVRNHLRAWYGELNIVYVMLCSVSAVDVQSVYIVNLGFFSDVFRMIFLNCQICMSI